MSAGVAAGMSAAQCAAARVVGAVLAGRNLDRALEEELARQRRFTPNERSAVHAIAFDTLRNFGLLDAQLDTLLSVPVTDVPVRHLLLVSLAQLQYSRVAPHAVVDQAVNAVAELGFARAKALVNAVLRQWLRAPTRFARERFKSEQARYDFPPWWIRRVRAEYPQQAEAILASAHAHPPMWLRVNRRRSDASGYVAALAAQGLAVREQRGDAVCLERGVPVHDLPGFREGLVSVQDLGAQLAAWILDAEPGSRVLDACAAPGGKAAHILEIADVELLALDQDAQRLSRVDETFKRLGLAGTARVADAAECECWWDGRMFDRILVDAACSGSGVVRRHPDIKWLRRESDLAGFARQQERLLNALWRCLEVGGRLLYTTCSVFAAENDAVIGRFLAGHAEARRLEARTAPRAAAAADPFLALLPSDGRLPPDHAHDGFFYALLEKAR
ncbi:MAG TPA: 16S rRNA (cytosine(967)-C(5))-methyltransferase RsmB [Usitatibacteraceae bacterium]|nr:16S rRNA (cytosine(967)-C(5))-methyltransferase RsmB [Usitatibacteraceae bacterium]